MISEFPFTDKQLRKESYRLSDRIFKTMTDPNLRPTLSDLSKDLDIIAAKPFWSQSTHAELGYKLSRGFNEINDISTAIAIQMLDIPLEDFNKMLMKPISIDFIIIEYIVAYRQNSEPTANNLTNQLRNIRLAYRLCEIVQLNYSDSNRHFKFNTLNEFYTELVYRTLPKHDSDESKSLDKFMGEALYVLKHIDQLSLKIAFKIASSDDPDSEFVLSEDDLKMLAAFQIANDTVTQADNPTLENELTLYGIPTSWLSETASRRINDSIFELVHANMNKNLLETHSLYKTYTLAQNLPGTYNYALNDNNEPLDFEKVDDSIKFTIGSTEHLLPLDLTSEELEIKINEIL